MDRVYPHGRAQDIGYPQAAVPFLVAWWGRWTYRQWSGAPRRWLAPAWSLWTLLVVVAVAHLLIRFVPVTADHDVG